MIARSSAALVVALFASASAAVAQPPPEVKDGKVTIPLTLTPAAAPKPLSESYLQPEYAERRPGDKLSGFLKCFMEQDTFYARDHQEKMDKWVHAPLADLPADVRKQAGVHDGMAYRPKYASMMVMADHAARYTRTDWNEYFDVRHDGIYTLLPEVQKLRALAVALHVRLRGEIKAGEFDKAVVSVRSLFGLARMLETHPTMIANLVGIAVATFAVNSLEELIAQPGCPSLYWSFADLPTPFFSLREGTSGERLLITTQFGHTVPADRAMTDKEIAAVFQTITDLQGFADSSLLEKPLVAYGLLASDAKRLDAVRERLTNGGTSAEVVKAMPKLQLALLEDLRRYEITRDEIFKWMNRPHSEAVAGLKEVDAMVKKEKVDGWVLGPLLLPAAHRVKGAQARLDQRLAYLMTVEAVRLHANENGGKLPEKLTDVKVAVPNDPVTAKPFAYSVKEGVATLTGGNATGTANDNRVYELRLRK